VTIDKSLRGQSRLARVRSVLSRDERILRLETEERFTAGTNSPFGLPKVRIIKMVLGKKKKVKKAAEEGDAAKGGAKAAAAPAAKAAAPAAKKK
jgi:small basic protein (TIGR04137 family)